MRTIDDERMPRPRGARKETAVFLADPDPLARHVLQDALRRSGLAVTAASMSPRPKAVVARVDAAVLATDHRDSPRDSIHTWTQHRVPVLLIGVGWTQDRLHAALSAGAMGCLVKDSATERLGPAVRAVVSGHMVLSPDLMELYAGAPRSGQQVEGPVLVGRSATLLTSREREVLAVLAQGLSTAEAARRLGVSPATVKSHISHALTKLGARNRIEAILMTRPDLSRV